MTPKEMKDTGYEMQGIAMDVKSHLISLERIPDSLPSVKEVQTQVIHDLDLLVSLAMDVRRSLVEVVESAKAEVAQ